MKKFFLFGIIAFAALSVTSCTKDEVIEIMPQEAIEFGTYLGHDVQSRGVVLDNTNFRQFGVFASIIQIKHSFDICPLIIFQSIHITGNIQNSIFIDV